MPEKNTAITPTREGRSALSRPFGWGASPFRAMQRLVDDMDRMLAASVGGFRCQKAR
jgi:hypothetical protein